MISMHRARHPGGLRGGLNEGSRSSDDVGSSCPGAPRLGLRSLMALGPCLLLAAAPVAAQEISDFDTWLHDAPQQEADGEETLTAANPGPHDPGLLMKLSLFDRDPRPDELERFEPGLNAKLAAIAEDENVLMLGRRRAIAALGDVGSEEAFSLVASLSRDTQLHDRLRMAALWTIGHRFDDHEGREEILRDALSEEEHGLRLEAVRSLAAIGSDRALELIEAHRMVERHVTVRAMLRELREEELGGGVELSPEGLRRPPRQLKEPLVDPRSPRERRPEAGEIEELER